MKLWTVTKTDTLNEGKIIKIQLHFSILEALLCILLLYCLIVIAGRLWHQL
jgi:hypothetical protein